MKLSVIIPTYNRSSLIDLTLESFLDQSFPEEEFEILVVDNASQDDTREIVKKWQDKSDGRITFLRSSSSSAQIGALSYLRTTGWTDFPEKFNHRKARFH